MERDEVGPGPRRPLPPALPGRAVLPAGLLARAQGDPRLPPRASAARSPTRRRPSTTSAGPPTSTRGAYANRADWQLGEELGVAEILISERIAWQVERHFGRYGELRDADGGDKLFLTGYSNPRGLISWVFGLGAHARLQGPEELTREFARRLKLLKDRHGRTLPGADAKATPAGAAAAGRPAARRGTQGRLGRGAGR